MAVAIIAILVGLLLPAVTKVRQRAVKTACKSNLRQIGLGVQMYRQSYNDKFPAARYMPEPFVSGDSDPPLPRVIAEYLPGDSTVFKCPGDRGMVYDLCGTSFTYNNSLSGRTLEESWFARRLRFDVTEIPVSYGCDGDTFELTDGTFLTVPPFHALRNLLFADGHVGNFERKEPRP